MSACVVQRPPRLVYVALTLMWVSVAMGIYGALTEPFTESVPGFVGRLLGPVAVTLLLAGRYAHGRLRQVGVLLGSVLSVASLLLIIIGVVTRH